MSGNDAKSELDRMVDIAGYYRNLAIENGAKPEHMLDAFDRTLCEGWEGMKKAPGSITMTEEMGDTAQAWEVLASIEDFILWPQQDGEDHAKIPCHLHAELADHSTSAWVLDAIKEVFQSWWECDVERIRLERGLATGRLIGPPPTLCDLTEEAADGVVARLVERAESKQAPHLRRGQAIANEAAYWAPVVSMNANREGVDPFYNDEKIPAFLAFLRKNAAYIVEPCADGGEE